MGHFEGDTKTVSPLETLTSTSEILGQLRLRWPMAASSSSNHMRGFTYLIAFGIERYLMVLDLVSDRLRLDPFAQPDRVEPAESTRLGASMG